MPFAYRRDSDSSKISRIMQGVESCWALSSCSQQVAVHPMLRKAKTEGNTCEALVDICEYRAGVFTALPVYFDLFCYQWYYALPLGISIGASPS